MANTKGMTIKIDPENIMYTTITKDKEDGYNYARMVVKIADRTHMNISVNWQGDESVPQFAMDMMKMIQANKEIIEKSKEEKAEEFEVYQNKNK